MGVIVTNTPRQRFALCTIQSLLREVGLYNGKIDGLIGTKGINALNSVLGSELVFPGTYAAKEIIELIQKAIIDYGVTYSYTLGEWDSECQTAFLTVIDNYREKHHLNAYDYAWSSHPNVPRQGIDKIERWLTGWGKPKSHVSYLLSCIGFETAGTFLPNTENTISKALGLIQFMPKKLKEWGVDRNAFAKLSFTDQLDYVFKFFEEYGYIKKCHKLEDYYLSIFYPAMVGHDPNDVIAKKGFKAYEQNKLAFDKEKKGYYTVGDVANPITHQYWLGMSPNHRLVLSK